MNQWRVAVVRSEKLEWRPGTVQEPKGRGMSAIGNRYQAWLVKTEKTLCVL
jgi:hypothetical protein